MSLCSYQRRSSSNSSRRQCRVACTACRGNKSTPEAFLVTAVQCEALRKGDCKLCSCQGDGQRSLLAVVQLAILLQLSGAVLLVPACKRVVTGFG